MNNEFLFIYNEVFVLMGQLVHLMYVRIRVLLSSLVQKFMLRALIIYVVVLAWISGQEFLLITIKTPPVRRKRLAFI